MSAETTGWGFPTTTARKAHYFSDGRSLCGKYGCFGIELTPHTGTTTPDDCAACTRKLTTLPTPTQGEPR